MERPKYNRHGIPFYHDKTKIEFEQDVYERYHEMVVRQSALHLADALWGRYPFRPIFDFAEKHYPYATDINILEIGCGVGRWISSLAISYPDSSCWGIDYSYQMLKRANEFWVEGQEVLVDLSNKGLGQQLIKGEKLNNLKFGLANAEKLPFDDDSQDIVISSFLLDRLENPIIGLKEMYRVLRSDGQLIIVSPLNFNKSEHWKLYYPSGQLSNIVEQVGFKILDWKDDIVINEPLDRHGNHVQWNCLGFVLQK